MKKLNFVIALMLITSVLVGFSLWPIGEDVKEETPSTPMVYENPQNDQIISLLNHFGINSEAVLKFAPHFPSPEKFESGKRSYEDAFKAWAKKHGQEFVKFSTQYEPVASKGFAWESVNMKTPYNTNESLSSFSQAAKAFSAVRLAAVAPNFPQEVRTGDMVADRADYEKRLRTWQDTYPQEYEDWLNAPEIMALKPKHAQQPVVIGRKDQLPDFMDFADIDARKPEFHSNKGYQQDQLNHEMRLQHWYFVFHPDLYKAKYGKLPTLPADFDLEAYRQTYKEAEREDIIHDVEPSVHDHSTDEH